MEKTFTSMHFLISARSRRAGLLALMLGVLAPFSSAFASYEDLTPSAAPMVIGRPVDTIAADEALHEQRRQMFDYLKNQGAVLMPSLSGLLHNSNGWAAYGVQAIENQFDFASAPDHGDNAATVVATHPVSSLMQPPSAGEARSYWLSSAYHHKSGVLPFHDAMVLGFNSQHSVTNGLQMELHPYYAQHCVGLNGYYGSEASLALRGDGAAQPWGKISIGYVNGDSSLTDHGSGYDLHSEVNINEHLSLHAGVRQDEETDLGNYMMLRWKLAGD